MTPDHGALSQLVVVSDCCLIMQSEQIFSHIEARTSYIL